MCIENAQAKQAEVPNDLCRCRTEPRPIDEELCNIAYDALLTERNALAHELHNIKKTMTEGT